MYEKGDLQITDPILPKCELPKDANGYECDFWGNEGHKHTVYDYRTKGDVSGAYLFGHVIGGPEQIRLMIADLQEALEKLERRE